ncbi:MULTISPECIES: DNA alkylation repair protein [unclassified Granulicatella]|uniref:DNA alkylation repair protein n=1 Tax=unclassified Granulicatella TaxID=2630493 RepID=UPI00107422CA|nr:MULTISPECIES: DNA alkylation repair protein [unclassified Granulicatella]MBF0781146.1 DNA alkylation repair protein [Granulicatella sp. 19428wC4_WM01]TFU91713.1 DNA alkylation repair protein [Granulicatella sp. WM01]
MIEQILQILHTLEHEGTKKRYQKINEVAPYIGVPMGELRKLAKQYKQNNELFMPLWKTGILEAQYLALFIIKPHALSCEDIFECISQQVSVNVLDKFLDNVLAKREDMMFFKSTLKESDILVHQRLFWGLERHYLVSKKVPDEELVHIFHTISNELVEVQELVQWPMNRCLVEMAVNYPNWLDKCYALGSKLGVYKEMKVPKGCTSAYAPEWIDALLKRQLK